MDVMSGWNTTGMVALGARGRRQSVRGAGVRLLESGRAQSWAGLRRRSSFWAAERGASGRDLLLELRKRRRRHRDDGLCR